MSLYHSPNQDSAKAKVPAPLKSEKDPKQSKDLAAPQGMAMATPGLPAIPLPMTASKKVDDLSRHESNHDLKHEPKHDAKHDSKHDSNHKPEDGTRHDKAEKHLIKPAPPETRK